MKLIAHRGNINGANPSRENSTEYIQEALEKGYDVEIDVWLIDGVFRLGHDKPQYHVDESFLENDKLWCHAKNFAALERMLQNKKIHCFWAEHDSFPITSRGVIWTEPGKKEMGANSICVLPEKFGIDKTNLSPCLGVCSDFVINFV